jgi:hypothetical protein
VVSGAHDRDFLMGIAGADGGYEVYPVIYSLEENTAVISL